MFYRSSSLLTRPYTSLVANNLERHAETRKFRNKCAAPSKGFIELSFLPSDSDSDHSVSNVWKQDDDSSSVLSAGSSPHDVPKIEAHLYFAGVWGPNRPGPKLIFRTSSDVFEPPDGPEADRRLMWLLPVYEHQKLGENNLWELIRSEVCNLLNIQWSTN